VTVVPVRWLTVFLDFPAGSFGAGVTFWAALTGWEGQGGDRSAQRRDWTYGGPAWMTA
jgi:hypothetical protein